MITIKHCSYGNHDFDTQIAGSGCIYSDARNGIKNNTPTCPKCFFEHMIRFYPDSKVTAHLRKEAYYKVAQELTDAEQEYDATLDRQLPLIGGAAFEESGVKTARKARAIARRNFDEFLRG